VGRGRGLGRGRGQPKKDAEIIVGSSSGSDVTVSPTGSVSGEVVEDLQERLESVEFHDPVVPVPGASFNPDTDFPISRMQAQAEMAEYQPPQTRLNGKFPGTKATGRSCALQTNHFTVRLKFPEGIVYQYDVTICPPWYGRREYRRSDKQLYHDVIKEWKKLHPIPSSNHASWVFDGNKQLYCTKLYKREEIKDMEVTIWYEDEGREIKVRVKDICVVGHIEISKDILEWASGGRSGFVPQDALQALDVVLKEAVNLDPNIYNIGRSYFHTEGATLDLGFGKEVWTGNFSCVRPYGWKEHEILVTLNVDTAHKPASRNLHLTNETAPGKADSYTHAVLTGDGRRKVNLNFNKGITEDQSKSLEKDLKDLKVKYILLVDGEIKMKRNYKVNGLKKAPNKEIIADLGKTVEQYFKETYNVALKFPNMPCVWVGSKQKTIYVPMEFCSMEKQPMPIKKKLPEDAIAKMIRATAVKPDERQKKIIDGLKKNNSMYKDDPYAREFGINVSGEMAKLTGRVLDAPIIEYAANKTVTINNKSPGKWFQDKCHYVSAKSCTNWCLVDLAGLKEDQFKDLVLGFSKVGQEVGMNISKNLKDILQIKGNMRDAEENVHSVEEKLKQAQKHFVDQGKKLEMILFIFPFKAGFLYDKIKQLCDMKYNIVTQCMLKNTVFKLDKINLQVVGNICLKINSKLGGINHILAAKSRPAVLKRPVMVMGADVSHPSPESRGLKPSIAAIVGSVEPKAANYEVEIRIQDGRQNEEMIHDMKQATKNLLIKFHAANKGRKPDKLIMYRDGVSEGQFLTVLAKELNAMRQACKELEEDYQPAITYIIVQKRHHTRFFPSDNNKYRNGNALAGTVVDQGINHPTEGDFYLLSHEGIQGTSRPCHYQVLWDDSEFSADELEVLSYYLCHLYSRCTRAVSYPTPTYYAHLVADRARKHHNELSSLKEGSVSGSGSGGYDLPENQKYEIKKLVEEGVKNSMYFV